MDDSIILLQDKTELKIVLDEKDKVFNIQNGTVVGGKI